MNNNLTIFDVMYPKYKITKPIRLIECFAGYGSQALALKYLGVPFEHWKICEWAIKSIQAYKDIHFENESAILFGLDKEQEVERLYKQGISSNYNEPMAKEQINRLSLEQIYRITENNLLTHNLVNIQQVKGKDLEIIDTDKYEYIMTYSFPCQDLSLAGKGKGMSDTSTRSGMLWEVERILTECKQLGSMPQILLMENVPQIHNEQNIKDFHKWQVRLEELGYKSYWQDLIATDFGIPQTRNRCFMVSILGDYSYTFPKPIPLRLKLKDMLEDNVDEKYYLSDKLIENIKINNEKENYIGTYDYAQSDTLRPTMESRTHIDSNVSGALLASGNHNGILIKNATKQGYLEATDGDGIDISGRMEHHRGNVQKDKIQTLTTSGGNDRGVCVKGIATNESKEWQKEPLEEKCRTILANKSNGGVGLIDTELRIRKLTPRECGRLMNVKDEDIDKIQLSDSAMYHIFGDSICTNVLMAIFGELLDINWKQKLEEMLYGNTN